jgi:hypothetical protein
VRRDVRELVVGDVDDREHVQRAERGPQAVRLGERGERIAAGDEEGLDVSRLDLGGERDRRDLPEDAGKLGPTPRRRKAGRGRRRSASTQPVDDPAVEVHAGGAIERARGDEDDPAEPLREYTVAAHRHAGAAVHRDAPRVCAYLVDESLEEQRIDVGGRRGPFDRETAERGTQRGDLTGVAVCAQLVLVGAALEQCVGQRPEHRNVRAGPDGHVHIGARRGLGPTWIEHPDPTAPGAVLAQVADRVRERGAVAVGDDRVGADEDRHAGDRRIPHRIQHRLAAHELGGHERGRIVDGDRGDERATADRREPLARRDLPGRVIRKTRCEVEPDGVRPARVDDHVEASSQVGEQLVPRHVAAVQPRMVEAPGRVMPRSQPASLRAHIPARHRMVFVASHP